MPKPEMSSGTEYQKLHNIISRIDALSSRDEFNETTKENGTVTKAGTMHNGTFIAFEQNIRSKITRIIVSQPNPNITFNIELLEDVMFFSVKKAILGDFPTSTRGFVESSYVFNTDDKIPKQMVGSTTHIMTSTRNLNSEIEELNSIINQINI